MIYFEINGQEYRSAKLDTFKQLHVSRKIGPLVPKLFPAFASLSKLKKTLAGGETVEGHEREIDLGEIEIISKALQPVLDVMAEASERDVEYVFANCLAVVQRKQGKDWQYVWRNDALMFDDIELPVMTQIAMKVIWDNLGPFISGLFAKQAAISPQAA